MTQRMGRPSGYSEVVAKRARFICTKWGPNDADLAEALGISCATLYNWKKQFPKFLESVSGGKLQHDAALVVTALQKSAFGYKYEEEFYDPAGEHPDPKNPKVMLKGAIYKLKKIKHPDPRALALIVLNRYGWQTMRKIAETSVDAEAQAKLPAGPTPETGKQELVEAPEIARLGLEIMENRHGTKIHVESEVKDGQEKTESEVKDGQEKTESEREERTGRTDGGQVAGDQGDVRARGDGAGGQAGSQATPTQEG